MGLGRRGGEEMREKEAIEERESEKLKETNTNYGTAQTKLGNK